MKVKEMLKLSGDLRKRDCSSEAELLCAQLGLDMQRRIEELSMGNRKKVGIVCALQHRPALYILDEPTSGLDPLVQKEFFSLLMERNAQGATVLLSSHVLSEVQRYCRNAAIIREGRIIAAGTVEELASNSARRVRIQGMLAIPPLAGIKNPNVTSEGSEFLYQGDMGALVRALAAEKFDDLIIEEPDIEEVFMHFYERGETALPESGLSPSTGEPSSKRTARERGQR